MATEHKMPAFADPRTPTRFSQTESSTYECLTNQELPQWQRDFSQWAWYTRTPLSVWNEYIKLPNATALKLVHGKTVKLEQETIDEIIKLTRVMQTLLNKGVLPTNDRKCVAGCIAVGVELVAWQDWYQAHQAQLTQTTEGA